MIARTAYGLAERLPAPVRRALRAGAGWLISLPYRGRGRWCPVCGRESRCFAPFGKVRRPEARCVHCGALERHRLIWLYFKHATDLFDGRPKTMLHIAPEPCLGARIRERVGAGYLSADLRNPGAMVNFDIQSIPYPDASFDVIYCSHVLEHVADDRRAMRELRRVLRPDGWAILLVPVMPGASFEDASIVDPRDRLREYGDETHVRRYGRDYEERLREEGFHVRRSSASDVAGEAERRRMGLTAAAGDIYFCTRVPPATLR